MAEERPRERMLALGGERISDPELLAIVLGTGTRGRPAEVVAAAVLAETGGLVQLARASPRELSAIAGVGQTRALRIAAGFVLARRAAALAAARETITGPADVHRRMRPRLAGLHQEVFVAIGLDARAGVIEEVEIARGTAERVDVHPRDVFRPLVRMNASVAIVVHNHPSGDPTPSADDEALTERLRAAGELIGIPIVEHVVFADGGFACC